MKDFFVINEKEIVSSIKKVSDATDNIVDQGELLLNSLELITDESIKDSLITNNINKLRNQITKMMVALQNSSADFSSELGALITDIENNDNYK